jgi:YD repeat-containing protein
VFVTSTLYKPGDNFLGLAGADAACQTRAETAGLKGTYKAWLSDATAPAKDRIKNGKYVLLDNSVIATSSADLIDGNITSAIKINENGNTVSSPIQAWTGTMANGEATAHCNRWSSSDYDGTYGNITLVNSGWTNDSHTSCSNSYRFYCFQTSAYEGGIYSEPVPVVESVEHKITLEPGDNQIEWKSDWSELSIGQVALSLESQKIGLISSEQNGFRNIYKPGYGGQNFAFRSGQTYLIQSQEEQPLEWTLPKPAEVYLQLPQKFGEILEKITNPEQIVQSTNTTSFLYDGEGQRIVKTDSAGNTTYYISPLLEIVINADGTKLYRKNYFFGGKFVAVRQGP